MLSSELERLILSTNPILDISIIRMIIRKRIKITSRRFVIMKQMQRVVHDFANFLTPQLQAHRIEGGRSQASNLTHARIA